MVDNLSHDLTLCGEVVVAQVGSDKIMCISFCEFKEHSSFGVEDLKKPWIAPLYEWYAWKRTDGREAEVSSILRYTSLEWVVS
jgi:hypothetical protein